MEVAALKFVLAGKGYHMARVQLNLESPPDLEAIRKENAPAAFVVGKRDLDRLKSFEDLVEDRGEKKPSIDLARRLLGRKKIPLIDAASSEGGYGSTRRVINGVRHLLLRAEKGGKEGMDHNIYFVGATDRLFQRLAQETGGRKDGMSLPLMAGQPIRDREPETRSASRLIDLLCGVEVPRELESRYVGKSE